MADRFDLQAWAELSNSRLLIKGDNLEFLTRVTLNHHGFQY